MLSVVVRTSKVSFVMENERLTPPGFSSVRLETLLFSLSLIFLMWLRILVSWAWPYDIKLLEKCGAGRSWEHQGAIFKLLSEIPPKVRAELPAQETAAGKGVLT